MSIDTVISAREPRWADQAHSAVVLLVTFNDAMEIPGEVPFAASPLDPEPHGVDLFERAVAGEFGPIEEPTRDMVLAQVMCMRGALSAAATQRINELVAELDMLEDARRLSPEGELAEDPAQFVHAELDAWRLHRVQLAQLDTQPGFPLQVDWPTVPEAPFVLPKAAEANS